jgi:hypothetical protein
VAVEELPGTLPEAGGRVFLLVVEDLGIGQPGMIIHGVMQVRVSGPPVGFGTGLVPGSGGPADHPVAAAVGDAAEFLDVHVHQVPGMLVFVADGFGPADRQSGGLVQMWELGQAVSAQDFLHGGPGQVRLVGDTVRPPAAGKAQRDDPSFSALRCLMRTEQGS